MRLGRILADILHSYSIMYTYEQSLPHVTEEDALTDSQTVAKTSKTVYHPLILNGGIALSGLDFQNLMLICSRNRSIGIRKKIFRFVQLPCHIFLQPCAERIARYDDPASQPDCREGRVAQQCVLE